MINQTKATEQYFPLVPFIMLYKVILTFESLDEIKCDHSNESLLSSTLVWCCLLCCISCCVSNCAVEGDCNRFEAVDEIRT